MLPSLALTGLSRRVEEAIYWVCMWPGPQQREPEAPRNLRLRERTPLSLFPKLIVSAPHVPTGGGPRAPEAGCQG